METFMADTKECIAPLGEWYSVIEGYSAVAGAESITANEWHLLKPNKFYELNLSVSFEQEEAVHYQAFGKMRKGEFVALAYRIFYTEAGTIIHYDAQKLQHVLINVLGTHELTEINSEQMIEFSIAGYVKNVNIDFSFSLYKRKRGKKIME